MGSYNIASGDKLIDDIGRTCMSDHQKFTVSCQQCSLSGLCIPNSLTPDEMDIVEAEIKRAKPLQKNTNVFEMGEKFKSLYAVRSGAFKAFTLDLSGEEHVAGFFLPGEMMGLDAIGERDHPTSAKALETSTLCEIPFDQIDILSKKIHNLQTYMYKLLSKEIREDQQLHFLLSKKTAEERIGTFLLNLSGRYKDRQLSSTLFRLPMSRTDIANFLGLAVETVSRVLTRLQNQQVLKVDGKEVEILDHNKLCLVAFSDCPNS